MQRSMVQCRNCSTLNDADPNTNMKGDCWKCGSPLTPRKPVVRWRRFHERDWKRWSWRGLVKTEGGWFDIRFVESCEIDPTPEWPSTEEIERYILQRLAKLAPLKAA